MSAAFLPEVPGDILGEEPTSRAGNDVDGIVTICLLGSQKNPTQPERRVRVHPMANRRGHFGQPRRSKIEDCVREYLSVRTQLLQLRNAAGIEHPVELDRPGPAIRSLPRGILTEESRLGVHILLAQM